MPMMSMRERILVWTACGEKDGGFRNVIGQSDDDAIRQNEISAKTSL